MSALGVPLLQDLCILRLADNIHRATTLQGLSEELVCELFEVVINKGRLTPEVLQLFTDTEHETLLKRVKSLKLQTVPPRLPVTRNLWLGQNPKWY